MSNDIYEEREYLDSFRDEWEEKELRPVQEERDRVLLALTRMRAQKHSSLVRELEALLSRYNALLCPPGADEEWSANIVYADDLVGVEGSYDRYMIFDRNGNFNTRGLI